MHPDTMTGFLRRIALLVMLLPFVIASSVPSGFMPHRSDAGAMTLVLCTADGPQEMTLDLGHPEPRGAEHKSCPWALTQSAIALPGATVVLAPPVALATAAPLPAGSHLQAAILPGPRTARAPPALA